MNREQKMVLEFHKAFDIKIAEVPTIQDESTKTLRLNLIDEEYDELKEGLQANDLVQIADALTDMLYVLYGFAVSYGIDLEPVFKEVHRSNMSKVGGYKREDGKWVKPLTYSPADIASIIQGLKTAVVLSEAQKIGTIIAEMFVGKKVRFPDLAQQFSREEVHTVEHLKFGGYDICDESEDPGVEIQFLCSHAPGDFGSTNSIVACGLHDRVEFVE